MKIEFLDGHWPEPMVCFSVRAWAKIATIVDQCKNEVSWFATVDEKENNRYTIENVYLFEQTVTAADTEIDAEAIAEVANSLLEQGLDEEVNQLRCWGHSHVNMPVNPSVTDRKQALEFDVPWMICTIHNKKGEVRVDFYDYELGVVWNDLSYKLDVSDFVDAAEVKAELEEKVHEHVVNYPIAGGVGSRGSTRSYPHRWYGSGGLVDLYDADEAWASAASSVGRGRRRKS